MSLDSNVMKDEFGKPLKYFTPHPTPLSARVNVFSQRLENEENPYVFPPFGLIFPLLNFLKSTGVRVCTMVVPCHIENLYGGLSCYPVDMTVKCWVEKVIKMFCWYHRNTF